MSKLIIQILTKIFTQNVDIQEEIVKKNVEICHENEKQAFLLEKICYQMMLERLIMK